RGDGSPFGNRPPALASPEAGRFTARRGRWGPPSGELLLDLLAQHLAGRVAGERVGRDAPAGRHLEVGEPLLGERDQLLLRGRGVGEDRHRRDLLPEVGVGHADAVALPQPRVLGGDVLELARLDVPPAAGGASAKTATAATACPRSGWGTPTTAHSRSPGYSARTFSTSIG